MNGGLMSPELSWVSLLWWRPFFQRCSWVSDFVPSSVALGLRDEDLENLRKPLQSSRPKA